MKENNIKFLQAHVHHWHSLRDAGWMQGISIETAKELLRIAQEEYDARYQLALHHPQNVCELMRYVYTQFELYLQKQQAQPVLQEGPTEERLLVEDAKPEATANGKPGCGQTGNKAKTYVEKLISFENGTQPPGFEGV